MEDEKAVGNQEIDYDEKTQCHSKSNVTGSISAAIYNTNNVHSEQAMTRSSKLAL